MPAIGVTMSRYSQLFSHLEQKGQRAFVPFVNLGDPDADTSAAILRTLVEAGADALELGFPFSDPVADGPTIQAAGIRALAAGFKMATGWKLIEGVRAAAPDVPIGLLIYANLVVQSQGGIAGFYRQAFRSGVDSVLIGDLPLKEVEPYRAAAIAAGVETVLMAPPNAGPECLAEVARQSSGYVYVVSRSGVTGADVSLQDANRERIAALKALSSPPCLIGFGISQPDQVRQALDWGADGAISGSAVVKIIERNLSDKPAMLHELGVFVRSMKEATRAC